MGRGSRQADAPRCLPRCSFADETLAERDLLGADALPNQFGAALATVVDVLIEVPVMLSVVKIANSSKGGYDRIRGFGHGSTRALGGADV